MKEKWIADFSKPKKSCFVIKSENSYNAYLEKGALFLGLKNKNCINKNCMAWIETARRVYVDQIIDARFRFGGGEGRCAAGIMFRIAGHGSYYLALVSNTGHFRLDAVSGNIPRALVGWTEATGLTGGDASLRIIARGDHFIFLLNGKWIAEASDASFPGGHLGFALVSCDAISSEAACPHSRLHFFSVDARAGAVAAQRAKWDGALEISAESRLRLAENFAALGRFDAAYGQILKAWKQREEAARGVMSAADARSGAELLFAARMASRLGRYADAEEYVNARLAMGVSGGDILPISAEMAKVLSAQNRNEDLAAFLPDCIKRAKAEKQNADIPPLYALLGCAFWGLRNYKAAAGAWGKSAALDRKNGLYKEAQALAAKMSHNA